MFNFAIIFSFLFIVIAARGFGSVVVPIAIMTVFAGIRGNVGYDTCSYKYLYSNALTGDFEFIEPGFLAIMRVFRHIANDPQVFLMFLALAQGYILYLISQKTPNKLLWLGVFIGVFYYSFFYSTLRNALSSLLLTYSYSQYINKRPMNPMPIIAAPLIHYTAIIEYMVFPWAGLRILLLFILLWGVGNLLQFEEIINSLSVDVLRITMHKLVNLSMGLYQNEINAAPHVILAILITQLLIVYAVRGVGNILAISFITTGAAVADLYFGRIGRVQIFGLLILTFVCCYNWQLYTRAIKFLATIVFLYYSYSFTVYPIVFGNVTQKLYSESVIDYEPGSYHIWLFNDKNICEY